MNFCPHNGFKGSLATPSHHYFSPCHLIPSKAQRGQQRSFYFSVFSTARDCSPRHPPCRRTTSTQRLSSSYKSAVRQLARPTRTSLWPQVATTLVSNLKHTARRLNSLRGGRATNSKQKSVTAQSSATLLRQAGLYSVLESAKLFREACSNGTLALSPRDAFDYQKHGWLTGDAEGASQPNI